ncbi:MAG: hypothetical protein CL946_02195 [Ectothiorhodospiraceae bacterium]|nr:hypothetical protein [Ectothiorhodospiraceae bacterium]
MKPKNILSILISAIVGLFVILGIISGFIVDLWWFISLGYESVFWTQIEAEYTLGAIGFVVFFLIAYLNIRVPLKMEARQELDPRIEKIFNDLGKFFNYLLYAGIAVLSLFMGGFLGSFWQDGLFYMNAEGFGIADPIFGNDVGFYIFSLPFIEALRGWLLGALILTLIGVVIMYAIRQGISFSYGHISITAAAQRHISILVAVIFVLVAGGYWLDRFGILYSTRSGSFYGAGYTDVNAQLLGYWIMIFVSLAAAVGVLYTMFRRKYKQLIGVFVGFVVLAIVAGGVYPTLIQKFIVDPTEQSKERPYIENNIKFTRIAYELNRIAEKPIEPDYSLNYQDISNDSATINNIMLWDYRPLRSTLDQLQVIRLYYDFPDVDIDRYTLPDGDYRQVMIGVREMNQNKLPQNAQTWVNLNLVYTHGYGISMSPVNVVTEEGLPEFFIQDIPPESSVGINLDRAGIYYGELTNGPVVTNGAIEEFDYPVGDQNKMTTYDADAGVDIGSIFPRLMFAMQFSDLNLLISQYMAPESRIHYYRNITQRVNKIAPFLGYDEDPYAVVADGKLYWIYDAYTMTDKFPYSMPYQSGLNYIRNSVKIVIDAYTGETTYYAFNEKDDPIVRSLERIYPELFTHISEMPESLRDHIRYPQDLFDIQSNIFETYHMTDPQVFYNKEDLWNIANEKLRDNVTKMESYYALIRLPGEDEEEFIQMIPYTPNRRDNMIAWLCARSDGENYGKMLVYKFPKQDLTYGPMQISARIDQDPEISQQLTLWNQQGSSVTRGNLLVIPIKEELLYIQPIYLQATSGKLPELKRVIVSYGNSIAMEQTLDGALNMVFAGTRNLEPAATKSSDDETVPTPAVERTRSVLELSLQAQESYNRAQNYLKEGNWAKYGEAIEQLETDIQDLVQAAKKGR